MHIVLAPDAYKGSLTALEVAETMKKAITDSNTNHHVIMKPMADGGEGTVDALLLANQGKKTSISCTGPLGDTINTYYGVIDEKVAVMECANLAGLMQVPYEQRNPDKTTTYGIGEAIKHALDRGCTSFIIGLGGSATNDGGLGMLLALGMQAWDRQGEPVGIFGRNLQHVHTICLQKMDPRLCNVNIKVASDVDNPLCGESGASNIYGPQKGATSEQVKQYDHSLRLFSDLIESKIGKKIRNLQGAGAAGGLGFALMAIGATLVSGAKLVADAMQMELAMKQADIVITGEGQSDEQTLYGKAPGYIAELAAKHNIPVLLISGSLSGNLDLLNAHFAGCFSVIDKPMTLEVCMEQAEQLVYNQTKQLIHLLDATS